MDIMADNKRQHFVPQFYLRNFSDDGLHIHAYNIRTKNTYNTQIRTSCQKDYFYGKNLEVEELLRDMETVQKKIIDEVIVSKKVDASLSEKYEVILSFLLMQKIRTLEAKNDSNLFLNHCFDLYIKPTLKANGDLNKYSEEDIEGLKIHSPDFFYRTGIPYAVDSCFALMDLRPVIIEINSEKEFLTSDNPVIFNNYVDFKDYPLLALISPGLQIICPITNKLMLFLFDNDMYQITGDSISDSDIDSFNEIQILNSCENVFFKSKQTQEYVDNFPFKNIHKDKGKRIFFKILEKKTDVTNNRNSEIHSITGPSINYCQKFSFIKLNHKNNRKLKRKLRIISQKKLPQVVYRNEFIFEELKRRREG